MVVGSEMGTAILWSIIRPIFKWTLILICSLIWSFVIYSAGEQHAQDELAVEIRELLINTSRNSLRLKDGYNEVLNREPHEFDEKINAIIIQQITDTYDSNIEE